MTEETDPKQTSPINGNEHEVPAEGDAMIDDGEEAESKVCVLTIHVSFARAHVTLGNLADEAAGRGDGERSKKTARIASGSGTSK